MKRLFTLFLTALSFQLSLAQRDAAITTNPKNVSVKGETLPAVKGETLPTTTTPRPKTVGVSQTPGKSPLVLYPMPSEANAIATTTPAAVPPPRPISLPQEIKPEDVQPVITTGDNGSSINWTNGYIEATGRCFIDRNKFSLPGQADELAKSGAEAIARRNLLMQVEKVRIIDTITLVNQAFERQVTLQILDGYIKNAYRVGNFTIAKDYVDVTMRMNLRDGENSVAAAANKVIERAMQDGGVVAPSLNLPSESALAQSILDEGFSSENPLMLNLSQANGAQPSLYPTLKFITEDGKELLVSTAPIMSQIKGGQQAMNYIKMAKNVLKSLDIKGYNIVDGLLNADGSVTIQLKNQPKAAKFFNILKKFGASALKYLPTVLSLF